jgi:hypothetical protein
MIILRASYRYAVLVLLFLGVSCSIFPVQTPPPTQATEVIRAFYMNNGGCELPCLWGIVPGQTRIETIEGNFSQIATFHDITRSVDHFQTVAFTVLAPNDLVGAYDDEQWSISLRLENDVVVGLLSSITVIEDFSNPSLAKFLSYFGQPEEIRISVIESQLVDENPDYEIALYYPSKGVFIRWRGGAYTVLSKTEKGITLTACPQYLPIESDTLKGFYPPFFYLFSPDGTVPFDEIIYKHLSEDPSASYQPLSTADVKKFYTMYSQSNTQECFPLSYTWLTNRPTQRSQNVTRKL